MASSSADRFSVYRHDEVSELNSMVLIIVAQQRDSATLELAVYIKSPQERVL